MTKYQFHSIVSLLWLIAANTHQPVDWIAAGFTGLFVLHAGSALFWLCIEWRERN